MTEGFIIASDPTKTNAINPIIVFDASDGTIMFRASGSHSIIAAGAFIMCMEKGGDVRMSKCRKVAIENYAHMYVRS